VEAARAAQYWRERSLALQAGPAKIRNVALIAELRKLKKILILKKNYRQLHMALTWRFGVCNCFAIRHHESSITMVD
jgi:hypothetical protein